MAVTVLPAARCGPFALVWWTLASLILLQSLPAGVAGGLRSRTCTVSVLQSSLGGEHPATAATTTPGNGIPSDPTTSPPVPATTIPTQEEEGNEDEDEDEGDDEQETGRDPRETPTATLTAPPTLPFAPDAYIAAALVLSWLTVIASIAGGTAFGTGVMDAQAMIVGGNHRCAAPQVWHVAHDTLSVVQPTGRAIDGDATLGSFILVCAAVLVAAGIVFFRKENTWDEKWEAGQFPSLALLICCVMYSGIAAGVAATVSVAVRLSPPVLFGLVGGVAVSLALPAGVAFAVLRFHDGELMSYGERFAAVPTPVRQLVLPTCWWWAPGSNLSRVAAVVTCSRLGGRATLVVLVPLVRALAVAYVAAFFNDETSTCTHRGTTLAALSTGTGIFTLLVRPWRLPTANALSLASNATAAVALHPALASERQRIAAFVVALAFCAVNALGAAGLAVLEREWVFDEVEQHEATVQAAAMEELEAERRRAREEEARSAQLLVPPEALPMISDLLETLLRNPLPHERRRRANPLRSSAAGFDHDEAPLRVNMAGSDDDCDASTGNTAAHRRPRGRRRAYF